MNKKKKEVPISLIASSASVLNIVFSKMKVLIIFHFILTTIRTFISSIIAALIIHGIFGINEETNLREFNFSEIIEKHFILKWFFSPFGKKIKKSGLSLKKFLFIGLGMIIINSIISYFDNKIEEEIRIKSISTIKNELMKKFRNLSFLNKHKNKDNLNSLIENDCKEFGGYWEHLPNHIYHSLLTIIIYFISHLSETKSGKEKTNWYENLIFYFLILVINSVAILFSNLIIRKRKKQKEIITKEISVIRKEIDNIFIIESMGLIDDYEKKQIKISEELKRSSLEISKIKSLNFSVVYELFYDLIPIILILLNDNFRISALNNFRTISRNLRDLINCLSVDYPNFFISLKRIKDFISLPEIDKNEINKKIIEKEEKIKSINLVNVSFSYKFEKNENENKKNVFENYRKEFYSEKINKLEGKNGSGKSTLLYLILGIVNPDQGRIEIITFDKDNKEKIYILEELNKKKWREKNIAYFSHENLIDYSYGSTGQKQWENINNLLEKKKDAQIWLFDEAGNALDEKMKKELEKIFVELTKVGKIVIVVDHNDDISNNDSDVDIIKIK